MGKLTFQPSPEERATLCQTRQQTVERGCNGVPATLQSYSACRHQSLTVSAAAWATDGDQAERPAAKASGGWRAARQSAAGAKQNEDVHRLTTAWPTSAHECRRLGTSSPSRWLARPAACRGSATPMKMGGRGPGGSEARIFFRG